MVSENWKEVVSQLDGFDLNNLLNPEFLEDLNKLVNVDETINCVEISFIVRDEVLKLENNDIKEITIKCNNIVDTIVKTIYLDSDFKKDELKEIIEKYK